MRLFSTLSGIDSSPTTYFRRASEDGSEDLEDEELETCPFTHDFRDDPTWVGMVDDDFSFLGRRGDLFGYLLDGVHFEELGEIVSDITNQHIFNKCRWRRRCCFTCHPF